MFEKGDIIQCIDSTYEFRSATIDLYFKVQSCYGSVLQVYYIDNIFKDKKFFNKIIHLSTRIYSFKKISNHDYIVLKLKGIVS